MFVRSGTTWTQQTKLTASVDAEAADFFGTTVAISGETVVIGADLDDNPGGVDAGAAYVFVRSGTSWTLQKKLVANDALAGDFFGRNVAISGDTVLVGASSESDVGVAYVFVRSGTAWSQQTKFSGSAAGDDFGRSVAISGDSLVVGALGDGSAVVFVRSGTT